MTHDELLEKIDWNLRQAVYDVWSIQAKKTESSFKALRAVVELHYQQNEGGYCDVCPDYEYPCRTIQAIEKELG